MSYGPFPTLKSGFHQISFEKIDALDSYFIHRYIIIKDRSVQYRVKSANYYESYGIFSTSFFSKCLSG